MSAMKPAMKSSRIFEAPVVWWVALTSSMHWRKAPDIRGRLHIGMERKTDQNTELVFFGNNIFFRDVHPVSSYDVQQGCRVSIHTHIYPT